MLENGRRANVPRRRIVEAVVQGTLLPNSVGIRAFDRMLHKILGIVARRMTLGNLHWTAEEVTAVLHRQWRMSIF
jgi:hypothetical protein